MTKRLLRQATGDLYDKHSDACDWALERLADVLRDIGFRVEKKRRKEATLRVRVEGRDYPLLNPRFKPTAEGSDCLVVTVHSEHSDRSRALDRHLGSFVDTEMCYYVPTGRIFTDKDIEYMKHGDFVLPVRFSGKRGDNIDFDILRTPLGNLLEFLEESP